MSLLGSVVTDWAPFLQALSSVTCLPNMLCPCPFMVRNIYRVMLIEIQIEYGVRGVLSTLKLIVNSLL